MTMKWNGFVLGLLLLGCVGTLRGQEGRLLTIPEASEFRRTSTSKEVNEFCRMLAQRDPRVHFTSFGRSHAGQSLPLLILSDPGVQQAQDVKRPVYLVVANIHAGEVDGKEAVLALARDLLTENDPLLKEAVLLFVPNFNPDGNDAISPKNRPEQVGPAAGVGTRANAQQLDLNRDFVKLETPEVRALLQLIQQWNPLLTVDCHTTNGSFHRYPLTYDGPRNAVTELVNYSQTKYLPAVVRATQAALKREVFVYGDFENDHSRWVSYPALPRYGIQALAQRGLLAVLSESHSYESFAERIRSSREFVRANLNTAHAQRKELLEVQKQARESRAPLVLRTKTVAQPQTQAVKGYIEEKKDGRILSTGKPRDYECAIVNKVEATLSVELPAAYALPASAGPVADLLLRHGISVEELLEDIEVPVQAYRVRRIQRQEAPYQNHRLVTLDVQSRAVAARRVTAGSYVVRLDQPLARWAAYLLEPQAEDGLTAWNAFDPWLEEDRDFPVLRLPQSPAWLAEPHRLREDRAPFKPITADLLAQGGFAGVSLGEITWLEDGEHWLQVKQRKLWKVEARTGKSELFVDPEMVKKSLAALPKLSPEVLKSLLDNPRYLFSPDRSALLYTTPVGLVVVHRDGRPAAVLATLKGIENPTFSPDGQNVAFTAQGNLFLVDTAKKQLRQLTQDGGRNDVLNGRADWVYEEEIFNRSSQAYWWSPDSQRIAFLRFDDRHVAKFALTNSAPVAGAVETIAYPKAGSKNPLVKIGIVALSEPKPEVRFLPLDDYKPEDLVIARVGWTEGENPEPYAYVQNRTQTWLDVLLWRNPAEKPRRLLRETTKAWVEDLGKLHALADGSFLLLSERTGWKHIYHYAADGQLIAPLTRGDWDVRSIERVDEAAGEVYFTCNRLSPTRSHLAVTSIAKPAVLMISEAGATHRVNLAPKGALYVDTITDDRTPARSVLRELYIREIRTLNSNPVRQRANYQFGEYKRERIRLKDGFELEAALTFPPDFHPANHYPVWILTYAGPHAPTVRDGWGNGRIVEQTLAAMGVVVLRVDPRSASGKGAQSAWACYKQLGVQELRDLEEAVDWILKNPWADARRVGISGHSYGGFISAYALTHSKKFAAGIAGAPVTDWSLYDTIYTERYMGLPSDNKAGYDKTSVVKAAAHLHGQLLIVHGLRDDNVHAQNSHQLISALQKAGKDFDVMIYPDYRHPITTPHYLQTQLRFIRRVFELKPAS